MGKITDKRRVFIDEYFLCGFNATEAARRAGYAYPNKEGPKLRYDEDIAPIIDARFREMSMSADEVIARLTEQARAEYSDCINEDGKVDITKLVQNGKAHLVKKIYEGKYGKQIEFYDSQSALAMLAKYHGLQRDRVEHTGKDGGPIEHRDISDLSDDELAALRKISARHASTD